VCVCVCVRESVCIRNTHFTTERLVKRPFAADPAAVMLADAPQSLQLLLRRLCSHLLPNSAARCRAAAASSSFACVVRYLPAPHRVHELMTSVAAYLPAGPATHWPRTSLLIFGLAVLSRYSFRKAQSLPLHRLGLSDVERTFRSGQAANAVNLLRSCRVQQDGGSRGGWCGGPHTGALPAFWLGGGSEGRRAQGQLGRGVR